jgi:hypothetical protein
MHINAVLLTAILTTNRPQVATWEFELQRMLTARPDWT